MPAGSTNPEFLEVAESFQLGVLETEQPHPNTAGLSTLANEDLPAAIEVLRDVDREALAGLSARAGSIPPLAAAMRETLEAGGRIFLAGCGATGRLSLSLEIFARRGLLAGASPENVIGFMAGGDAALIRSIERFEDRPDHGERQLRELGFSDGDLLIASTEGGETPFVIGCVELAAERSRVAPFFLYGNPDELLRARVERSRRVIENPAIRKIELATGPMALSGSTRMQACTVLSAAIGLAMKHSGDPEALSEDLEHWRCAAVEVCDWSFLEDFVRAEAALYSSGGYVLYEPGEFGITVLTDTTERSPTFALTPFERVGEGEPPSLCYLRIEGTETAKEAWHRLLGRSPRPLEWGSLRDLTGAEAMAKFDFSTGAAEARRERIGGASQVAFRIFSDPGEGGAIRWQFGELDHVIAKSASMDSLGRNLLLKMLLNAHSTLVMGRLGRYEGNLMTHVDATNFKLIDRAVRYVRLVMERHHGGAPDYETVARRLLHERERIGPDEAIVSKTVERILREGPQGKEMTR